MQHTSSFSAPPFHFFILKFLAYLNLTENFIPQGYRIISVDIPRVWSHHEWIHAFEKFLDGIDVHHVRISKFPLGHVLCTAYYASILWFLQLI